MGMSAWAPRACPGAGPVPPRASRGAPGASRASTTSAACWSPWPRRPCRAAAAAAAAVPAPRWQPPRRRRHARPQCGPQPCPRAWRGLRSSGARYAFASPSRRCAQTRSQSTWSRRASAWRSPGAARPWRWRPGRHSGRPAWGSAPARARAPRRGAPSAAASAARRAPAPAATGSRPQTCSRRPRPRSPPTARSTPRAAGTSWRQARGSRRAAAACPPARGPRRQPAKALGSVRPSSCLCVDPSTRRSPLRRRGKRLVRGGRATAARPPPAARARLPGPEKNSD